MEKGKNGRRETGGGRQETNNKQSRQADRELTGYVGRSAFVCFAWVRVRRRVSPRCFLSVSSWDVPV
jgi:hypothetical protein